MLYIYTRVSHIYVYIHIIYIYRNVSSYLCPGTDIHTCTSSATGPKDCPDQVWCDHKFGILDLMFKVYLGLGIVSFLFCFESPVSN